MSSKRKLQLVVPPSLSGAIRLVERGRREPKIVLQRRNQVEAQVHISCDDGSHPWMKLTFSVRCFFIDQAEGKLPRIVGLLIL